MSIVSVRLIKSGLSGNASLDGIRKYRKVFIVVTDSPNDGVIAVGNAAGIPRKGDVYQHKGESDSTALCRDVSPQQDDSHELVWTVTCNFASDPAGRTPGPESGDPARDVENPLDEPIQITWSDWTQTELITHDINGEVIINYAGKQYNPPLQRQRKRRAVTVVRNELTYPHTLDRDYQDAINEDEFFTWPAGTAKVESITGIKRFNRATSYWQMRYEFWFRLDEPRWRAGILEVGAVYLEEVPQPVPNPSEFVERVPDDKNGVFYLDQVALNEQGGKLTPAEVEVRRLVPNGDAGGLYRYWDIFPTKSFSAFNFEGSETGD